MKHWQLLTDDEKVEELKRILKQYPENHIERIKIEKQIKGYK